MNIFRNNSRVFSGKIGRKLLMALGSPYKKQVGLPCAMRLLMKRFSELHALGLFDAVLKLMLREDLRLSELNLLLNLARVFLEFRGEYWEFSLLALQLNVEDINLVHGLFGPRQQDITPVFRLGDTALN